MKWKLSYEKSKYSIFASLLNLIIPVNGSINNYKLKREKWLTND